MPWLPTQPKENIWVTLANATGQNVLCLSVASSMNPFSTCLVGLPLDNWTLTVVPSSMAMVTLPHPVDTWDGWVVHQSMTFLEPQEIDLLGSVKMDMCLYFNYTGQNQSLVQNVNSPLAVYRNASLWRNYTSVNFSHSSKAPILLP